MAQDFFHPDMRFFIERRVDWRRYYRLRRPGEVDVGEEVATSESILTTLAEICTDLEAESRGRWHEEVRLVDGQVVVPPHIAAGYEKLRKAGLVSLIVSPEYGGFGLPVLMNSLYLEMIARADASLMTIVGLQAGVAGDIERYGSDEIKRRYLPGFASGEYQGCMDLTEPQAGSDLGAIQTRVSEENGRFYLDGAKIFITNGGSPVHLVLARDGASFEQSKGTTNGLCLMLCPTVLPDGKANHVRVSRVETKMGIHGSPTCAIEFDHAEAFLLGQRGNGFRAMLDLMNAARLGVAAQAIGIAEAAYCAARKFASERVQFDQPIIQQPLVKQMLSVSAMDIAAARALLYNTCALFDQTEAMATYLASERKEADVDRVKLQEEHDRNLQLIRFFTPLCKYYATEVANEVTRRAIQVHGGIGYMAESVSGHLHNDSIITTIYEGTSEIQASFALREMSKGALFTALDRTRDELVTLKPRFPEEVLAVSRGIEALNQSLPALMVDPAYALLNAKRVCDMVIDVVASAELLFQADASPERTTLASAFVMRQMLEVDMNARRIQSGDASRLKRYDQILGL
jgi:alkylation response protein AidB-like acyl-CoA dehydrogenase